MEIPDSEERGLEANPAEDTLPSTGLLSFYDRLRERILRAVERRGGRLGGAVAETLLLAPDVFMLLARLSLDKEVPKETRVLVSGALAYFLLPVDLLPEMVVGVGDACPLRIVNRRFQGCGGRSSSPATSTSRPPGRLRAIRFSLPRTRAVR